MKRIIFRLTMPRNNAWNNKWTGEGNDYSIARTVKDSEWQWGPDDPLRWTYNFGDGWMAAVTAKVAKPRERASGQFCGYEWMVDSILKNRTILA